MAGAFGLHRCRCDLEGAPVIAKLALISNCQIASFPNSKFAGNGRAANHGTRKPTFPNRRTESWGVGRAHSRRARFQSDLKVMSPCGCEAYS
jgi:hypothetical protein